MDELLQIKSLLKSVLLALRQGIGGSDGDNAILYSKLDDINNSVNNIKISADSVNLNTDELESKISESNIKLQELLDKIESYSKYTNPKNLGIISTGDNTNATIQNGVVLCNITENNIDVEVVPIQSQQHITVTLQPGWNPIIVSGVYNANENTLIYGY